MECGAEVKERGMLEKLGKKRTGYLAATIVIFLIELLIALFVRDKFIRPYVGDMLVVVLLYTCIRIVLPEKPRLLPLYVFLLSTCVELLQGMNIVERLGLQENRFFSVLIGTTFDWKDIVCYGVGCVLCGLWEVWLWNNRKQAEKKIFLEGYKNGGKHYKSYGFRRNH